MGITKWIGPTEVLNLTLKFIDILFKIWSSPIDTLSHPCYLDHSGKGRNTDYFAVKEKMQIESG